jgi:glutaredoxin
MLRAHKLEFVEVNLAKDPVGRRELAACTGHMTFPLIVIDGQALGGFTELQEADEQGLLDSLAS